MSETHRMYALVEENLGVSTEYGLFIIEEGIPVTIDFGGAVGKFETPNELGRYTVEALFRVYERLRGSEGHKFGSVGTFGLSSRLTNEVDDMVASFRGPSVVHYREMNDDEKREFSDSLLAALGGA